MLIGVKLNLNRRAKKKRRREPAQAKVGGEVGFYADFK